MQYSTDTAAFLRSVLALYDDELPTTQRIGICTISKAGKVTQRLHNTPELAADNVQKIGQALNCYFETCTNPVKLASGTYRLTEDQAQSTGNVHLDIDFASPHRKKGGKLPETEDAALAVLAPLWEVLPPSLTVRSGYGLQVYWCFKEPADLTSDKERQEHKAAAGALHQFYKVLMTKAGYQVDNVTDLARLMRIPGGWNVKNPDDPRQVTFEDHGPRYNPSDIIDALPDMPEEKPTDVVVVDASPLSVDPSEVLRAIDAWREISTEVDTAWRCKRKDGDTSLSGQIQSFISGVCANDPDRLIPDAYLRYAIEEFYRRHGRDKAHKLKGRRKDFQDRTIKLARSNSREMRSQDTASNAIAECNAHVAAARTDGRAAVTEAAKEVQGKMLEAMSERIGTKVLAIKRYMTEPSTFIVETAMGACELGTTEAMMNKAKFVAKLIEITGCVVDLKRKEHHAIVQGIINAAQTVELGPEATDTGILRAHVSQWIESNAILTDKEAAIEDAFGRPFWHKGRVAFRLEKLATHLLQIRYRHEPKDLPRLLKQAGFDREGVKAIADDGKRTERSCWLCPADMGLDAVAIRRATDNPWNATTFDQ